jgi:flagellar biogenesis protein FliO
MFAPSAMGLMSIFIGLAAPISFILLLIWVFRINKNSEVQVEQNKRIIELLEKVSEDRSEGK